MQKRTALKGHVANYEVTIPINNDPLIQLADTRLITKEMFSGIIKRKKGFKIKYCSESEIKKRNRRQNHLQRTLFF